LRRGAETQTAAGSGGGGAKIIDEGTSARGGVGYST
jgi:hypothetical protein